KEDLKLPEEEREEELLNYAGFRFHERRSLQTAAWRRTL
ncbi:unnamed protein product, partial [Arabidopsis lyrata]